MRYTISLILFFIAEHIQSQNLKSGGVLKPEQAIMDIRHYTISLTVDPNQQTIDGTTEIDFILTQTARVLLFDLANVLSVKKVWVNTKEHTFTHGADLIRISLSAPLVAGKATVKIQYGGKPAVTENAPWAGGFTWAKDSLGHPWVAITCQGEGAKIYFPCKDHPSDEPNEGADLKITVPEGLYVAGPGLLKSITKKKSTRTFHWKTAYSINNYSILFNIGKYKVVSRIYTTVNGNRVPMQFYVLEEHAHKADRLLDVLERCVQLEEKYFGEYPWINEKLAICETPHLGMEHQTMNAYGNKFQYTQSGGKDFDWLLLHELGHEWWGNKVTAIDWADLWIQEGICTFGDHLYTLDHDGNDAYLRRMQQTARYTHNQKPIVQGKNLQADVAYQSDIYGKGAFFMHTLRYIMGDDIFFPTLKKLATDPKFSYVNSDDVEQLFSAASGTDLKPIFNLYLRTINKLEVRIKQISDNKYLIQLVDFDSPLPMDVQTDAGIKRLTIDDKGILVTSSITPVADPDVYYLKRVILE